MTHDNKIIGVRPLPVACKNTLPWAPSPPVAEGREEHEPCERGTVGCSVLHGSEDTECATW